MHLYYLFYFLLLRVQMRMVQVLLALELFPARPSIKSFLGVHGLYAMASAFCGNSLFSSYVFDALDYFFASSIELVEPALVFVDLLLLISPLAHRYNTEIYKR